MKKKLFARIILALCCAAMLFTMTACAPEDTAPTAKPFELLDSHEVIITDIGNGRIVVADLDKEDPFATENLIWEWSPTTENGWTTTSISSLAAVKYRWSEHFKTNVVLFAAAGGYVGVVEYPSGKCLMQTWLDHSPHSIEMLPNGDIIVASSGGGEWDEGRLYYLQLKSDGTYEETAQHMLNGAHGVLWDPDNEVLWAVGFPELVAYVLAKDSAGKASLSKLKDWGCAIPDGTGHDLMPDYSNPDILWLTDNVSIMQYSKSEGKLLDTYPNSQKLAKMPTVKGVTSFTDGVVVFVSYGDASGTGNPTTIRGFWPKEDGTFEMVKFIDEDYGWNKIRVFTTDYL